MSSLKVNLLEKVRYAIVITLLMGVALMLSPFKVYADGVSANPQITISHNTGEATSIDKYISTVNDYSQSVGSFDFLSSETTTGTDSSSTTITMNLTSYKNLTQDAKTKLMEYALDSIKNSSISTVASNKIYNFIESQDESTSALVRQLSNDVNADFAEAYTLFKPFSGGLGTILGVFTILIFVTLTMMILVDLSFIVIPFIRDFLTPDSAEAKPKYVSNEAWYAVKEVDSSTEGQKKDVLLVYLKKKTMQFVALSICILYLLSGQIYNLIGNMMDMFSGILG